MMTVQSDGMCKVCINLRKNGEQEFASVNLNPQISKPDSWEQVLTEHDMIQGAQALCLTTQIVNSVDGVFNITIMN